MTIHSDYNTFDKHFSNGKTQILYSWVPADLETPVSSYLKLCTGTDYSFLLESVEGGNILGRYSVIGFDPDFIWTCNDGHVQTTNDFENWDTDQRPPLVSLRDYSQQNYIDVVPDGLPPMAPSGLFGQIGYDMIRHFEVIPDANPDALDIPDAVLMRPLITVIFDHLKQLMCICTPVYHTAQNTDITSKDVYENAKDKINNVIEKLKTSIREKDTRYTTDIATPLNVESNVTRDDYHQMVEKAVDYIRAGEIFQVVPSQRFSVDFDLPSLALYRSLRRLNPSPFLFHVHLNGYALVGSSPEILVRVRDNEVTIRPIAGTRKRGATLIEDKANADDLLSDEKELAEHLMLLDLGRNDVGRVSEIGSVEVTEQFNVEYYSHVMHIVSNVQGQLASSSDNLDALFSGFPAGTVSGAPKIRAMEIIDELEPVKRKFYAGAVGYLGANGDLDTCIALRTALVKDGKVYIQAGGGVVADSDPEFEYQESCNKAKALISAAENAIESAKQDA